MPVLNYKESVVEKYLYNEVLKRGGECVKQYKRGWPDRLILWQDGVAHWVETKRPSGSKFQPLQLRIQNKLKIRGFRVETLYTKEQVDYYLQSL